LTSHHTAISKRLFATISATAATGTILFLPALNAHAQTAPPPSPTGVKVGDSSISLLIPELPDAKLTMEVDARDNDLLGVVKKMIADLEKPYAAPMPATAKPAPAKAPAKAAPAKGAPAQKAATPSSKVSAASPKALQPVPSNEGSDMFGGFLGQLNLSKLLADVRHLHVMTFRTDAAEEKQVDALKFYESSFSKEGGRRLFWMDEDSRVAVIGFDQPHRHIAVVWQQGKRVTVVRVDAYPDMTALTQLIKMFAGSGQ
jgi:hypothetical protein